MFAVVKAGGHQYKVRKGDSVKVDLIDGKVGDAVKLDQVLLIGGEKTVVGAPLVKGASVSAVIKSQEHNEKLIIFKYRRRKNSKKRGGHKQPVTIIEIGNITV